MSHILKLSGAQTDHNFLCWRKKYKFAQIFFTQVKYRHVKNVQKDAVVAEDLSDRKYGQLKVLSDKMRADRALQGFVKRGDLSRECRRFFKWDLVWEAEPGASGDEGMAPVTMEGTAELLEQCVNKQLLIPIEPLSMSKL